MKKLAESADKVWRITALVASVFILFNMFLILANIVMRRFFNAPIFGSTEIVSYASLITAALALAQNEWFGGNIQMTLVTDLIPRRVSKYIVFIDNVICSCAFVFITYLLRNAAVKQMIAGDYTQDLKLPLYIFYILLAIGFGLLTVCIIIKTVICGYNAIKDGDIQFTDKSKALD